MHWSSIQREINITGLKPIAMARRPMDKGLVAGTSNMVGRPIKTHILIRTSVVASACFGPTAFAVGYFHRPPTECHEDKRKES